MTAAAKTPRKAGRSRFPKTSLAARLGEERCAAITADLTKDYWIGTLTNILRGYDVRFLEALAERLVQEDRYKPTDPSQPPRKPPMRLVTGAGRPANRKAVAL